MLIKYVFFKCSLPVIGLSNYFDTVFHKMQVFNIKEVRHENDFIGCVLVLCLKSHQYMVDHPNFLLRYHLGDLGLLSHHLDL